MRETNRNYLLLLAIFVFSFVFRMLLIFWDEYPPGADIGLHNSVIYSITGAGNTDFFYNYFHIGGGPSLTFPGYHIFLASVFYLTGMPEFVAHGVVVALFSSLVVLVTFLITKRVWSTSAAVIVAFLASISRFDIEMLMWAGYPNVITLMLIPLTFYLFIERERFTKLPFLASTSVLVASIFLTHSLSAGIFFAITAAAVLGILLFPKKLGTTRKTALYWALPVVIGAVLVAPFIVEAIPAYLEQSSYLAGSEMSDAIGSATLSTRVLPLSIVLPLFGLIAAFAVFSKRFYNRWFTVPVFLLSAWVFVCLVLTQGYLVKFPFDYNRFLYFLILPLLVFLAVLMDYGAEFFAHIIDTYQTLTKKLEPTQKAAAKKAGKLGRALTHRNLYTIFASAFLVFSFVGLPIFMSPTYNNCGQLIQNYYQTMDNQGWEALQWLKSNTQGNAVLVTDALYGWWLGGFSQRPTLSAVDPQFLALNREVDNATFATNLLDTDYLVDNGYLQVREDGGYLGRHNPEFLAKIRNEYYPFPFFNFDNNATKIVFQKGTQTMIVHVSDLPVVEMHLEQTANSESIVVTHGNSLFSYTQKVTLYAGSVLADVTETFMAHSADVAFVTVQFDIATKSSIAPIVSGDHSGVGLVDKGMKTMAQISFPTAEAKPNEISVPPESKNYSPIGLTYALNLAQQVKFSFYMGTYQYQDSDIAQIESGVSSYPEMVNGYMTQKLAQMQSLPSIGQADFVVFDYKKELAARQVGYVIVFKNPGMQPKFTLDPQYSLVFINEEAAIYRVNQ